MKTAFSARQQFLAKSDDIIKDFLDIALKGEDANFKGDAAFLEIAFKTLVPIIHIKDDPVEFDGDTKQAMIDDILDRAKKGTMPLSLAEPAIAAIRSGIDVVAIDELLDELEKEMKS